MRKYITLFAAAYITLFSTTAANAESSFEEQLCQTLASVAETVQADHQLGLSSDEITKKQGEVIRKSAHLINDRALRRLHVNQMAEMVGAVIEDAITYPIQPSYELKTMITYLFKEQVYNICINS